MTNRKQYVEIKGPKSSFCIIKIWVPQGSLLGPRLSVIYVNDSTGISNAGNIQLYADDTTAFVVSQTVKGATECLNLLAKDIKLYPGGNPEEDPKQDPNKILRAMAWQDPNQDPDLGPVRH